MYQYLIDALAQKRDLSTVLPARIFVFGISALPPRYLQALHAISQHCEVHFFLNNPCQAYWGDIVDQKWLAKLSNSTRAKINPHNFEAAGAAPALLSSVNSENLFDGNGELIVGNPLLASMGKLGRDNQFLLSEIQAIEIEAFVESAANNLLGQLNNDILSLTDRSFVAKTGADLTHSRHKQTIEVSDDSLCIHSCHGPMREVEVLHDQLLAMFEQDPSLTPKDIVVMMPDVNAYSPYIQAVFGRVAGKQRIDFSISDRSAEQENPLLLSFLTLLKLPSSRHTSAQLFALLEVPAIMAKFELTPSSLERLKTWIEESGIRQGLGRDDATNTTNNSWQFGLNRMFKGYSQAEVFDDSQKTQPLWQDIFGYSESIGLGADILGQLATFIELIEHYSLELLKPRVFEQWQTLILTLIEDFYASDDEFVHELQLIKDSLVTLASELELASFSGEICPQVLFEHLKSKLSQGQSSQRFLAGKLNFCTLMPMRSIPFKVVCLLGMNDGSYPRSIPALGFDLMANDVQKGDRSRRDDDRYLFLEAMLSAQQKLYISFCGRSVKDNTPRNASVLVSELIDYIEQSYVLSTDVELPLEQSSENIRKHLITQAPLAPFSADYFNQHHDSRLFSYQVDWRNALTSTAVTQSFISEPLTIEVPLERVEITQLIRFFKQPSQYFLNQRLGVYFEQGSGDLESSEPFNPDPLQSYQIKATLLDSYLTDSVELASHRLRAQGVLPHGHFSQLFLTGQTDLMSSLAQRIKPYIEINESDIEVDIAVTNIKIQGWLKQHYGTGLVRYKSGKANIKFFIGCYIEQLCYCAQQSGENELQAKPQVQPMVMCAQDGQWQFGAFEPEQAKAHLAKLIQYFEQGQSQPLALFIKSGWAYINALMDKKSLALLSGEKELAGANKKFSQCFNGGYMMTGEGEDPYIKRCFGDLTEQLQDQSIALAIDILLPLRQQLEELDDEQ